MAHPMLDGDDRRRHPGLSLGQFNPVKTNPSIPAPQAQARSHAAPPRRPPAPAMTHQDGCPRCAAAGGR